jgi:hypothetical protein
MHRDPAFRGNESEESNDESSETFDGFISHDDDEADFG